jgi:hypothetical protein
MLFHLKMTHTPDNCPGLWSQEEQEKFFAESEKMLDVAKEMNIDIQFVVTNVGHTMYALVEADDFNAINMFFGGMKIKQEIQAEPVGKVQDVISAYKAEFANK